MAVMFGDLVMNDDTRLDCSDMPEEKKMCGECHFFDEFACGW